MRGKAVIYDRDVTRTRRQHDVLVTTYATVYYSKCAQQVVKTSVTGDRKKNRSTKPRWNHDQSWNTRRYLTEISPRKLGAIWFQFFHGLTAPGPLESPGHTSPARRHTAVARLYRQPRCSSP